ncbi:MAG: hypothetical protein OSJ43_00020 [Oscillospiraceae bacterium]|nr:hypothetical protein [Oscillospiraceae bacterium]
MIVNQTIFTENDLEFSAKHSRKEPRITFSICFVAFCGVLLLILGGATLYRAVSSGVDVNVVIVTGAFVMGVLFICWSIFFNKLSVMKSIKLPSVKAPRTYEFLDDCVLCRLSLNGINSEERYAYSIMDKYFEQNNAIYIRLNVDNRQRFLVVHNGSYSEGSAEDLKVLLESRGVHK